MKRIFIFLAAMLLSVGAMAQSETPLKGDVNGDGTVDVGDIAAIIDIMANGQTEQMYFYLGTAQPTESNYQSLPGVTTAYTSIDQAIGTKLSVAAGETLFMLCPIKWIEDMCVLLEDKTENLSDFIDATDTQTISGYAIFKTSVWTDATDVTLKEAYYFYVGTTKPTSFTYPDVTKVVTYPTELTYTNNSGSKSHIFVLVNSGKNIEFIELNFNAPISQDKDNSTINGNIIYETSVGIANGGTIKIKIF